MFRLPPLESLRLFEIAARHQNFSKAAAEAGITAAAMSQRMRDLQLDLGEPLFERRGPTLKLTAAGSRLGDDMGKILEQLSEAVLACRSSKQVRLSVTPTFGARWLAPRLVEMQTLHPELAIVSDVSAEVRPREYFDIAIRSGRGDWKGFESRHLFDLELTPMLSPSLAARLDLDSLAELPGCPLLATDDWPHWFGAAGLGEVEVFEGLRNNSFPTLDLAAVAALAGQGIALLSPQLFGRELDSGELTMPFCHIRIARRSYWIMRRDGDQREGVLQLFDWLIGEIGVSVAGGHGSKEPRGLSSQPAVPSA
ncbi:LysR family glycine cleavage system transcriptional activator [Sphingopyxis sp. OAS728]|uniref:LysR substrate-binding domain-containing protein n=1 Tax=Sphingopyxis sp. OAS728 TaxID=2663823 RepID=UPI00178A9F6F|nr:LysR substrate-binding domain-containing protein [Sphingopyxis sp. OAS728]MBE1528942.1 LysR family glycine cleavage system transcriptional activator [Sphingopyxis sp. OAS728]